MNILSNTQGQQKMNTFQNNENDEIIDLKYIGRLGQIRIFFLKFIRMFIYRNDWVTIPMAALIAGLVAMALGSRFGVDIEGTLMGVFALMCVSLWNGTFNSIQVICRERDVIKREHRSGMHISSFIFAHMLYQALISLIQCVVTLITVSVVGMNMKGAGLITPYLILDIGISLFLTTYAADMLALFISALVHTTTLAMTIMPFVLIFQMVFSGGLFPLPQDAQAITYVTISRPSFNSLSAIMNINALPYKSINDMVNIMDQIDIDVTLSGAEVLDMLSNNDDENVRQIRDIAVNKSMTVRELCELILNDDQFAELRNKPFNPRITVKTALDELATNSDRRFINLRSLSLGANASSRELLEYVLSDPSMTNVREQDIVEGLTVGHLISSIIYLANNYTSVSEALDVKIEGEVNVGDVINFIRTDDRFDSLNNITLLDETSVGEALRILTKTNALNSTLDSDLSLHTTVGEAIDYISNDPSSNEYKDTTINAHINLQDVFDKIGKDKTASLIEQKATESMYKKDYEHTHRNIMIAWSYLLLLIIVNSIAAIISLEFIDKDKR